MRFIHIKKIIFSILICILVVSFISPTPKVRAESSVAQDKKIVGYYASWAAYSGFTPDKIDESPRTLVTLVVS